MTGLDTRLLAAHAAEDKPALVALYSEVAAAVATPTAQAYFLTHAYVYALDCGHPNRDSLRSQLQLLRAEPPI